MGTNGPIEPTNITRMSAQAVNTTSNENMIPFSNCLNNMVKISAGGEHGKFPQNFAHYA